MNTRPLRIALVRPPGRFMGLRFPDGPMVGPPRSLLYLAAAIRGDPRFEVQVLDALAHPDLASLADAPRPVLFGMPAAEVARRCADQRADVVGISTMANYFRRETLEIVRAVRAALPAAFILLGGPDPTVDADGYLGEAPIDAVCLGEGEATFAELVGRLAAGAPWNDVAGLAFRQGDRVVRTPPREALTDLDAFIPDYALVDLPAYFDLAARGWRSRPTLQVPGVERTVDLVTSRGCPYRCSFCVIHASMGRRFRARSIASVLAELRALVARGVRHVHFEDDILNLDRHRFSSLLDALIDAQLPLTWDTPNGVRADLLDAALIGKCRDAGCTYLILGVESGSARVLDEVVGKDLDLGAVVEAARLCHEAELDALALYIVGMPGETAAEAEETFTFAFDLFDRYGTTPLLQVWRPYHATDLFDRAEAAGELHASDPLELHRRTGIPYTQFRERVSTMDVDALGRMFGRYGARLAQGQLARWRRAGQRVPLEADPRAGRAGVERFLLHEAPFLHAAKRRG